MAASTARNGQAADMGFEEARIRRKMTEIADWLKAQAEPPPAPTPPPAPRLHVVSSELPDDDTLDGIIQRRLSARRERAVETDAGPMREVMGRFSGPIDFEAESARLSLSDAVAEIVERQRRLERVERRQYEPYDIEAAFEKFAADFEHRAGRTFETLTDSVIELSDMMRNAHQPASDHADRRIEELTRDLAELRADAGESERRTRILLDTVRQTLEHVASRLPERAAPQPAEDNPSIRARAAAMRARQESGETDEFDLSAHVGPERHQLIAAARRAQATQEPAKYRQPRAYPIEAARPRTMKRTLIAGAAAAALLVGIYAGSSRFLDGVFSGPQTTTAAQTAEQPETATPPSPPPTSPVTAQVPQTPPPAISEPPQLAAAPALPVEPAITNSIPQTSEPVPPETLPAEIGGAKLRSLALAGDASAQFEVAVRFAEGRGVARDAEKAAWWMKRAADQGLAPAQYRLGSLMEKGNGVPKDLQGARRLYEQAAAAGNVQAMHNLGVLHAEGGLGAPDMAVAMVWFRKAAEFGVRDSQYNLGIFHARGLSVPQDLSQSYLWFSLAAAQGDTEAAARRDQIGAKLGAEKTKTVKVAADTWKPKAAATEANEVTAPAGGWDSPKQAKAN